MKELDLEKMVVNISATRSDRANALKQLTNAQLVIALEEAVALIDIYRTARSAGDDGAGLYLENVRRKLLGLMGIK